MHCSLIIRPIARLVFKQERKEGDFRFAHMRLRSFLTEITLYRAGAAERTHLDHALRPVLANQLRLVMWRWLLSTCTTGLEYAGALLNYSCLGLVVFTGGAFSWLSAGTRYKIVCIQATQTLSVLGQHSQLTPKMARTALTRCASETYCTLSTQQATHILLSRLSIEDWHCLYNFPAGNLKSALPG